MTPTYLALADIPVPFMEMIKAGSVIRTHASPGPHLKPINDEAKARMEEWYQEEHSYEETIYGPSGEPEVKLRRFKPHLKYKIAVESTTTHVHHPIELVSAPQRDQPGSLSLAETLQRSVIGSTDQRPGPDPIYAGLEAVEAAPDPAVKMRKS